MNDDNKVILSFQDRFRELLGEIIESDLPETDKFVCRCAICIDAMVELDYDEQEKCLTVVKNKLKKNHEANYEH